MNLTSEHGRKRRGFVNVCILVYSVKMYTYSFNDAHFNRVFIWHKLVIYENKEICNTKALKVYVHQIWQDFHGIKGSKNKIGVGT